MPTYQYEYDDEVWDEWKETVPRDTPLGKRIEELLEADAEGRVMEPGEEPVYQAGDDTPGDTVQTSPSIHKASQVSFIKEDDGEVIGAGEVAEELDDPEPDDTPDLPRPDGLDYIDFPASREREDCIEVVYAAYDSLRENGTATKADFVREVMPDNSLGYDAEAALEKIETEGERYRGGWWRSVVTPGLKVFDDVRKPSGGSSEWMWLG